MKVLSCAIVAACSGLWAAGCAPHASTPPVRLTSAELQPHEIQPTSPWRLYDLAVARYRRGQLDAAIAGFELAEERFGTDQRRGLSLSMYGRARALDRAGRCDQAKSAYDEYARYVLPFDPASAKVALAVAAQCYAPAIPDPTLAAASAAVVAGYDATAISLTEGRSTSGPDSAASPWLTYDRAVALQALHRTDEAVAAYRAAEVAFADLDHDGRGVRLAVYGRARALVDGYQCKEAGAAFNQYVALAQAADPGGVEQARRAAEACR